MRLAVRLALKRTIFTDTGLKNQNFLVFQTRTVLEKLLPLIGSDEESKKYHPNLWIVCKIMVSSFDKESWLQFDPFVINRIVQILERMDAGDNKRTLFLNARSQQVLSTENRDFVDFTAINLSSLEDCQRWIDTLTYSNKAPSPSELDTVLSTSFYLMDYEEFVAALELCENRLNTNINYLSLCCRILASRTKAFENESVVQNWKPNSLMAKLGVACDPNKAKLLNLMHWILSKKQRNRSVKIANKLLSLMNFTTYQNCYEAILYLEKLNIRANQETFGILIRDLRGNCATKLLALAKKLAIPVSEAEFNFMDSCLKRSRERDALDIYADISDKDKIFKDLSKSWIIESLYAASCYLRKLDFVQSIVEDIVKYNFQLNSAHLSSGIVHLCRTGGTELAQSVFYSLRPFPTSDVYVHMDIFAIVNGYIKEKQLTHAMLFVKELQGKNFPIGKRVRRIIMQALVDCDQLDRAYNWLLHAKQFKDTELLNILLQAYLTNGYVKYADELLKTMKEWNFTPNDQTYAVLISSQLKNGSVSSALDLLNTWMKNDIKIGDETFSRCIEYFVSIADWETIEKLWNQLRLSTIHDKTTSLIIKAFGITGQRDKLEDISKMINPCLHPLCARALIFILLRGGDDQKAKNILDQMSLSKGSITRAYCITEFIAYYSR
jgi:pentatricopeptide repeat protein